MSNKLPERVVFTVNGVECIAVVMFGDKYLLNMRTCTVNFEEKPSVNIINLPEATRVQVNDGKVWFDTDECSALAIKELFDKGIGR